MADVSIHFDRAEDGVAVLDPIEYRKLWLYPGTDAIREIPPEGFLFPVDAAVAVETDELRMERMDLFTVWSSDGEALETVGSDRVESFEPGRYQIEISGPIKLYLAVEGALTVRSEVNQMAFSLDHPGTFRIGARSYHEHPAATITVGDDPEDAMAAISTFASALKTTTPDVSFPTLRGHPPLIEYGDSLSIPDGLTPPETGVRIVVPPTRRQIYPTASLAFYLGARVVPGRPPRIETDRGFTYDLDQGRFLEDEIASVLRQVVLFDSVVRAAGIHAPDVREREAIEPLLETDLQRLYEAPVAERLAAYLAVSSDAVAAVGPRWVMTAYVPPDPEDAPLLPFVANELAIVRSPRGTRIEDHEARETLGLPDDRSREYLTRGERRLLVEPDFFDDSIEHVWFGDHVPVGATKGTREAFESRLSRSNSLEAVDVAVVDNDQGAHHDEAAFETAYRTRDDLDFSLDTYRDATAGDIEAILSEGYDFLHFVGETRPGALVGSDRALALEDLSAVEVGAFLLEADHSFEEALWLARNGALGGIGVVGRVGPHAAIAIGRSIAYLMTMGFPLRAALDIVRDDQPVGDQYVIVGNGSVDVGQAEGSMPVVPTVRTDSGRLRVQWTTYPSGIFRTGSLFTPHTEDAPHMLGPGNGGYWATLSIDDFETIFEGSISPAIVDGALYWTYAEIRAAVRRSLGA